MAGSAGSAPLLVVPLDVDGAPRGRVLVGAPFEEADGRAWRCDYVIEGLSEEFRRYTLGADALQALLLTLELMPVLLSLTPEAREGRLTRFDEGAPWGFPERLLQAGRR